MKLKQTGLLGVVLVFCTGSALAAGAELSDVRRELKQDIEKAQKELSTTETSISKEREKLARQINRAQNRVLDRIEFDPPLSAEYKAAAEQLQYCRMILS